MKEETQYKLANFVTNGRITGWQDSIVPIGPK